ncbi:hypothetical protein N7533_000767 [Penicillium manginii]|uniref:uncharacterized protein n=1 Tax=Penicillium manginii TaxID=203109 RepID=UPI00254743B1|nr:uncharacterized protein N7533_000767 [Penicillium manginii]KAJ5768184.1 hypothetical protein N7533_000767 [Penicillium manginii]
MAAPTSTPPISDPPTPNDDDSPGSIHSIYPTLLDEQEDPLEEGVTDNIVALSAQYASVRTHEPTNREHGKKQKKGPIAGESITRLRSYARVMRRREWRACWHGVLLVDYWTSACAQTRRELLPTTPNRIEYKLAHKSVTSPLGRFPRCGSSGSAKLKYYGMCGVECMVFRLVQVEQKEKGQLRLDSLFKPIVGPDTVSEKKPVSAKRKCA